MREITMWKETPTAPYSLKTFFSCWVLLGFPPSGSGPSGVFAVDEELIEASFIFCFSWTRKKKRIKENKRWKWAGHYEMGGWIKNQSLENLSVRRQTAHLDKNKQKIWLAKRKWMKLVVMVSTLNTKSWHFSHSYSKGTPQVTKLASSEIRAWLLLRLMSQFFGF